MSNNSKRKGEPPPVATSAHQQPVATLAEPTLCPNQAHPPSSPTLMPTAALTNERSHSPTPAAAVTCINLALRPQLRFVDAMP